MKNPLLPRLLLPFALAAAAPLAHAQTARRAAPALVAPAPVARPAANPAFRQTGLLQQRAAGATNWTDSVRYTYSRFTAANRPRLELREKPPVRGAALAAFRQERHYYNAANASVTDSTFTYNAAGAPNPYASRVATFAYNAQGKLLVEQVSIYTQGTLRPYARDTYTYDALGRATRVLYESYFGLGTTGNWFADSRSDLSYNAQGQLTQETFDLANPAGTQFSPFLRFGYTYNAAGTVATSLTEQYDNGAYANSTRGTFAYLPNGLLGAGVYERFTPAGTWVPSQRYVEGYDADDNLTSEIGQIYKNGAFVNDTRTLYTYQRILGSRSAGALQAALVALPNPAAAGTAATLRYALPTAAPVAVAVFDAAGRTVAAVPAAAQAAGPHTLALPVIGTPGLYLVRLSAGAQSQAVRLAVE